MIELIFGELGGEVFGALGATAVILLCSLALTAVILLWAGRLVWKTVYAPAREARDLRENGEQAPATILKIWDTGVKVNHNPQIGLLLEVTPQNREPYQVETQAVVSMLALPQVQPGSELSVYVDPQNPRRVALPF